MSTLITGNTYPVKDSLKALGGRWDATKKGWLVPDEKAEEARKLVAGTGKRKYNYNRPCSSCGTYCYGDCGGDGGSTTPRRGSIRTPGGLCTRCGDDCGGTDFRCNYE